MKSILFGDSVNINRVYPESTKTALKEQAGLLNEIICKTDLKNINTADIDFIFSTWGMPGLSTGEINKHFPSLKAVFYAAGSVQGFAQPFLDLGVRVFSAWAANGVPVAEYTLAQILLANKNFYACARYSSVGDNESAREKAGRIVGNYGCSVGIIGAGMIGSMVINYLKHHNLNLLVFDPFLPDERARELGVEKATLEQIFSQCQTISNHLANNSQTVGMLNYDLFNLMLPDAVFINTGRGAQVVEHDLCRVLTARPDLTAVLDVTCPEPPEMGHPFYSLPNIVLTPHIAGSMGHEVERMSLYMLEEFRRLIDDKPLLYEVTKNMLATMA